MGNEPAQNHASDAQSLALDRGQLDRLARERDFHNIRFSEENRVSQAKYYWAVEKAHARYLDVVYARSRDADIFELGCAKGQNIFKNPVAFRSASGVDISDVAVEAGNRRAEREGRPEITLLLGDAHHLPLAAESFDLVYGSGIIHHLDVPRIAQEVHRLLRHGGRAVFWEPLGHNPIINIYRKFTPRARTPDEHPLMASDVRTLGEIFDDVRLEFFGLFTLLTVPLRNVPVLARAREVAAFMDHMALRIPGFRWLAWFVVIQLEKRA